jgi:hypothetical protein
MPAIFVFYCTVDINTVYNKVPAQAVSSCTSPIECPACNWSGQGSGTCTKLSCATACNWNSLVRSDLLEAVLIGYDCRCLVLNRGVTAAETTATVIFRVANDSR